MNKRTFALAAAVAGSLMLAGPIVSAQESETGSGSGSHSGMGMGRGMGMGMMGGCPMMGGMMRGMGGMGGKMASHTEGRIAFLKAELGISDAQQALWNAYADALRKHLGGMESTHQAMMKSMNAASPVERLDGHISAMEGRVAALKDLKSPLATLYDALSDDQKKRANDIMTGMGCMM